MTDRHRWSFFAAGGFDQVKLETAADLGNLATLDQKLWVALACPTNGLEIDARTLALIDLDKDGRVRALELIAAIKFATANLRDPQHLFKGEGQLALAAIDDGTPEGKTLRSAARQILTNLGRPEANAITVEDFADPVRIFADSAFNGDGVITEFSTDAEPARAVIREIADCLGSDPDRSGKPGVSAEKIATFFAEAAAHSAWYAAAEADAAHVWPLGPAATTAAAAAIAAAKAKVDDYFGRCRLAAFDPRIAQSLNRKEEEYLEIAAQDLSITVEEIIGFPLAQAAADRPLPLAGPVNPAHAATLRALHDTAVAPLLGGARAQLTQSDWTALCARIAPYEAWMAARAGARVDKLGPARIREILASDAQQALAALMDQDKALEAEAANIENVERLVRYHRDLVVLCRNFVSFRDFYGGVVPAVFQCGTLYLDQRACRLCLRVDDAAKHASMAGLAGAYLAYLDCARKATNEKMQIVAVVTAGDSDNLMVGRNGLFYDRRGQDWDATITKIIDSPISLRQAFWSPYKKLVRFIEEQVTKRATAANAESHDMMASTATTAVHMDKAPAPAAEKKVDVGTVAALGVAVGAIGTFITAFVGYAAGVFKLGPLATAGALVAVMAAISLPSVILAYIKLRKRNLGPILDANGWAVNARAKISVPFGATLTSVARLPKGSRRVSGDHYADFAIPWKRLLAAAVLIYGAYRWYRGAFDGVLPEPVRSRNVLGRWAPLPPALPPPPSPPPPLGATTDRTRT